MALVVKRFSTLTEVEHYAAGHFIGRRNLTPSISGGTPNNTYLDLDGQDITLTNGTTNSTTTFASSDLPAPYLTVTEVAAQMNATLSGSVVVENFGHSISDIRIILLLPSEVVNSALSDANVLTKLGLANNDVAGAEIALANIFNVYAGDQSHVLAYWE